MIRKIKWPLLLLVMVACVAQSQVYNYFPPPGIAYTQGGGMALGTATPQGPGTLNAQNLYINGVAVTSGSGTVTSVTGAVANGLSVSTTVPTPNPVISVAPTFTGIAYSNGSGFSAAAPGNFPILNQNTTGNAATATTAVSAAAFSTSPSTCMTGQGVLQGITANGAPIACFTPFVVVNANANYGYFGPVSGTPALPTFRSMVPNDLPLASPIVWTGTDTWTPSAGTAITVNGATGVSSVVVNNSANNYAQIVGNSGTGTSFGLNIVAGTNSSDWALNVTNRSGSTQYARIYGDGGLSVGTAADEGSGALNAITLWQNGYRVPRSTYGFITLTSSSCSLSGSAESTNIASCSRIGAGDYSVTFTTAYASTVPCNGTLSGLNGVTGGAYIVNLYPSASAGAGTIIYTYNTSGTLVDPPNSTQVELSCVGT